jgi:hypothetical protein
MSTIFSKTFKCKIFRESVERFWGFFMRRDTHSEMNRRIFATLHREPAKY